MGRTEFTLACLGRKGICYQGYEVHPPFQWGWIKGFCARLSAPPPGTQRDMGNTPQDARSPLRERWMDRTLVQACLWGQSVVGDVGVLLLGEESFTTWRASEVQGHAQRCGAAHVGAIAGACGRLPTTPPALSSACTVAAVTAPRNATVRYNKGTTLCPEGDRRGEGAATALASPVTPPRCCREPAAASVIGPAPTLAFSGRTCGRTRPFP